MSNDESTRDENSVAIVIKFDKEHNRSLGFEQELANLVRSVLRIAGINFSVYTCAVSDLYKKSDMLRPPKGATLEVMCTPIQSLFNVWNDRYPKVNNNGNGLTRFRKSCTRNRIHFIGDLIQFKVDDVNFEWKGMGKMSRWRIKEILTSLDLSLGMDLPDDVRSEYLEWRKKQ